MGEEWWFVFSDSPAMVRQLEVLVKRVGGKEEPAELTGGKLSVMLPSTWRHCAEGGAALGVKVRRKAERVDTGKEGRKAAVAAAEKIHTWSVLGALSLLED